MKTNIRLSRQAISTVRPRDFWIAVAAVVFLLGGMGIYFMQTGKVPDFSPWLFGATCLMGWILALIDLVRYGKPAFRWQRLALLTGFTLYAVGDIWHHHSPFIVWAGKLGMLYIVLSSLTFFFDFGKQRGGVSDES